MVEMVVLVRVRVADVLLVIQVVVQVRNQLLHRELGRHFKRLLLQLLAFFLVVVQLGKLGLLQADELDTCALNSFVHLSVCVYEQEARVNRHRQLFLKLGKAEAQLVTVHVPCRLSVFLKLYGNKGGLLDSAQI